MVSFYPGPSQLDVNIKKYMAEAVESGILSQNHRSEAFITMSRHTITQLKDKLNIPKNYSVFFTSSATECWEIIGQSYLSLFSVHVYNGAFGEKWYQYRGKLAPNVAGFAFSPQKMLSINRLTQLPLTPEVLCLTHNETSNGTQVKSRLIRKIRQRFPETLLCIDATSSMGGVELDWHAADIWFASVQKCFGMPAGMAIMVCSPRAIQLAETLRHTQHYNTIAFMAEKMRVWQTTYTPNILSIFLLGKVMENASEIQQTHRRIKAQRLQWELFFRKAGYELLIQNSQVRSDTVFAVKVPANTVSDLRKQAEQHGFLLGKGYGTWKENTFRIANFPAISPEAIVRLQSFLANYQQKPHEA